MGIPETQAYQSGSSNSIAPAQNQRKRKADNLPSSSAQHVYGREVIDLTADTPPKKRMKAPEEEEKRLRKWRAKAPRSYQEIRDRALTQRMFVLDRQRNTTHPNHPVETISLAGTTGNVYSITIEKIPKCDCPHARKGHQCKHIIYVLTRVLRVPAGLEYQLAFVSAELRDIFQKAPPLPSEQAEQGKKDGNRKSVEGECPICCVDFEQESSNEEVVYCKASCGNNIHKDCFEQWAATKTGGEVKCPFCRSLWKGDEESLKKIARKGRVNAEGYVNVASELGMSGARDYSTYHRQWVQRQFGYDYF